jgi:N-acetyl-alpha-D-muramate 1-phosphate uridylyltransferase
VHDLEHAIVMAAGEGVRLRPLTERWAKPVLPIDGRPVVAMLLHELREAGVIRATIVTGHLAEQVEALVGDGSAFRLELGFARQPAADGSADAVSRALAAGARTPAIVTAADTRYRPGDVGRFAAAFAAAGVVGAIAARRGVVPSKAKPGLRVEDGRITTVVDTDPALPLTSAPLWGLGPELVPYLEDLPGPPWELAEAYQRAVDNGHAIAAIEIGKTRDLTDPLDLVEENFPYLHWTT